MALIGGNRKLSVVKSRPAVFNIGPAVSATPDEDMLSMHQADLTVSDMSYQGDICEIQSKWLSIMKGLTQPEPDVGLD